MTTYANLLCWFYNWDRFLVKFGFGTQQKNRSVVFSDDQRVGMLNSDESWLSIDGSSQSKAVIPLWHHDKALLVHGLIASKKSQTTPLITISIALGDVLPPHFEFSTTANTIDQEQFCIKRVWFMNNIKGVLGHNEFKTFPCTFRLNETGRMFSWV